MEEQTTSNPNQNQGFGHAPFGQGPFGQQPIPRPKNWLVESILVTIFCCVPFGIAGIVNAANVNARYDAGDYAGALAASQAAGKWTKIGFFIALGLTVLYIIAFFMGIGLGLADFRNY